MLVAHNWRELQGKSVTIGSASNQQGTLPGTKLANVKLPYGRTPNYGRTD